ncbi:MAG: hypothetical protein ABJZ55_13065 [Fuerstiella sp.]
MLQGFYNRKLPLPPARPIRIAPVPRCACSKCGTKTIAVLWVGKHACFALMFEAFAIDVLQACSPVSAAAKLLRIDRSTALERGLERWPTTNGERILDVASKRTIEACDEKQKENVQAFSMGM